ncbi:MAG: hypothetical protein LBC93_06010, partial [Synergistaceae bacterium]|jgi:hypothetical protein|nr:hypothetical protein [Synergistaceae bacterium]
MYQELVVMGVGEGLRWVNGLPGNSWEDLGKRAWGAFAVMVQADALPALASLLLGGRRSYLWAQKAQKAVNMLADTLGISPAQVLENAQSEFTARRALTDAYASTLEADRQKNTETTETGETVERTVITYMNGDVAETVVKYDADGNLVSNTTTRRDADGKPVDTDAALTPEQARQRLAEIEGAEKAQAEQAAPVLTSDTVYIPTELMDVFNQENPGYAEEHGIEGKTLEHGETKLSRGDYEKLPDDFKAKVRPDLRDGAEAKTLNEQARELKNILSASLGGVLAESPEAQAARAFGDLMRDRMVKAGRPKREASAFGKIAAAAALGLYRQSQGTPFEAILKALDLDVRSMGFEQWAREHGAGAALEQAMYRNPAKTIAEFRNNITSGKSGPSWFEVITPGGARVDITDSNVRHFHAENRRALTDAELTALADSFDNIEAYAYTEGSKGLYGQPVLVKINTPAGKFGVVLEYQPSGRVFVTTAFRSTDKGIDAWIKREGAHALAESKTFKQGDPFNASHPSIIVSIQEALGIVKDGDVYNQESAKQDSGEIADEQAFKRAYDELDSGNFYAAIPALRKKLGWTTERFDAVMTRLRDKEALVLQAGDKAFYTEEDMRNTFTDENGFHRMTVMWRPNSPYNPFQADMSINTDVNTNTDVSASTDADTNTDVSINTDADSTLDGSVGAPRDMTRSDASANTGENGNLNAPAPRANIAPGADGRWVITLFEGANASSPFHEFGHHLLTVLASLRSSGQMDEAFITDFDAALSELGVTQELFMTDSEARNSAQEQFARAWETYLATGKAPSKQLKSVFTKLRQWLLDVYHDIKSALGVELSDEMKGFFDKLLATPEEVSAEYRAAATVGQIALEEQVIEERAAQLEAELRADENASAAWNEFDETWEGLDSVAEESVDAYLAALEEQKTRQEKRAAEKEDLKAIKDQGGLRFASVIQEAGKDLAAQLKRKHPGLFRKEAAFGIESMAKILGLKKDALTDFLMNTAANEKRLPPLIEINADTLNVLINRLGLDGAREYLMERGRYLTALQKALQAEYNADKNNQQVKADLEQTYLEQKETAQGFEALDNAAALEARDGELEAQKAELKNVLENIVPETIVNASAEAESVLHSKDPTATELRAQAKTQLTSLMEREFDGVEEGEKVYFAPGNAENAETYLNHLIGGTDPNSSLNPRRVQALWLAESTIARPDLVTVEADGRKIYSKMYRGNKNTLHQIVIEMDTNGRVLTSKVIRDRRDGKHDALKRLENQLNKAIEIIHASLKTANSTSGQESATDRPPSAGGAPRHRPGRESIAQTLSLEEAMKRRKSPDKNWEQSLLRAKNQRGSCSLKNTADLVGSLLCRVG